MTLQVDCRKIQHNTQILVSLLEKKKISVTGVSKSFLGHPAILKAMQLGGVKSFADSRIETLKDIRAINNKLPLSLMRSPCFSQAHEVVHLTEYSYQSELKIIQELSKMAVAQNKNHGIMLMLEMGDLREGLMPRDIEAATQAIHIHPNIYLKGIGTNLFCLNKVAPTQANMMELSMYADQIEEKLNIELEMISGGNSANLSWALSSSKKGRINNLRLGESLLFGIETLTQNTIPGLHSDAITLEAEVIEAKVKPLHSASKPSRVQIPLQRKYGDEKSQFILNVGRLDIDAKHLTPESGMGILKDSCDHLVVTSALRKLKLGDKVRFGVGYEAFIKAFISPFVEKQFLQT